MDLDRVPPPLDGVLAHVWPIARRMRITSAVSQACAGWDVTQTLAPRS